MTSAPDVITIIVGRKQTQHPSGQGVKMGICMCKAPFSVDGSEDERGCSRGAIVQRPSDTPSVTECNSTRLKPISEPAGARVRVSDEITSILVSSRLAPTQRTRGLDVNHLTKCLLQFARTATFQPGLCAPAWRVSNWKQTRTAARQTLACLDGEVHCCLIFAEACVMLASRPCAHPRHRCKQDGKQM